MRHVERPTPHVGFQLSRLPGESRRGGGWRVEGASFLFLACGVFALLFLLIDAYYYLLYQSTTYKVAR